MVRCSVLGCKSDSEKKIPSLSFHSYPDKPESRELWIKITRRNNWLPKKSSKICSKHFHNSSLVKIGNKTYLHPESIPFEGPTEKENLPVTTVTSPETENPLFLENEPMEGIEQESNDTLSVKSENISMSDGLEEELESGEDNEKVDEHVISDENSANENVQEKDDEEADETEDVDGVDDDRDEDYEDDDDDDATDITGSVSCSSSEYEFFEEEPIPIPTTMAAPTTTVDLTTMAVSATIAASANMAASAATVAPTTTTSSSTLLAANYTLSRKQYESLLRQKERAEMQRKKIKALHNQIMRKNKKLENLKRQMFTVKEYTKCSEIENILRGNFRKLCTAINKNGVSVNYSDEVIKFALSLNYYSPKAYEFIRKYMSLPNTRMLEKYAATGTYILHLDD